MKEISGVFADKTSLDQAVEKIAKFGIKKSHISLLAREKKVKKALSSDYDHVVELVGKYDLPRMRYVSERGFHAMESTFIGMLAYSVVFAILTLGILLHKSLLTDFFWAFGGWFLMISIGMIISGIFRKRHGDYLERKLNKGGLLF